MSRMTNQKINWKKVEYFSFYTKTNNHEKRKVIPVNKLKDILKNEQTKT